MNSNDLHATTPELDAEPSHAPGRWLTLALLCLAQFILVLDVTAVNVALPSIGRDFDVDLGVLSWAITAYIVAFGGCILLGGRLADAYGRRRILILGLGLFAVSSALCGLAPGIGWLISGRIAQGFGAALISPAALATIPALFAGHERGKALGAWAGVGASGFAAGLMVGGALTAGPGWPWMFLVNVPIAAVLIPVLGRLLPALPGTGGRVDGIGAALMSAFAGTLVYTLTRLGEAGMDVGWTVAGLTLAAAALALFLLRQSQHPEPLMALAVLRRPSVTTGLFLMLLGTGAMLSSFLLASLHLQQNHALDPMQTGLACLPAAVTTFIGAHLAGRLVGVAPIRAVAAAALALAGAGAAVLVWASQAAELWPFAAGLAVEGIALGAAFVTATSSALRHVDGSESGVVSGIINTGHELGGALGIAAIMAVVASGPVGPGYLAVAIGMAAAAVAALLLIAPGRAMPSAGGHPHVH